MATGTNHAMKFVNATVRRFSPAPRPAPAFTFIEIMVSVGVLALLIALLIPSLSQAREAARRTVCANRLRQWGMACQFYRDDHDDFLPTEGFLGPSGLNRPGTWYNQLPLYLDAPAYKDIEGAGLNIADIPELNAWICPSKNRTRLYQSRSGKNQYHYGMNQVLDGLGDPPDGSKDAPGFFDIKVSIRATRFAHKPNTVFMFDILPNSPAGTPRDVATMYQRSYNGLPLPSIHGDYANIVFLDGHVGHVQTNDLVTDRDFREGDIVWRHPRLYWGYLPPIRR